LHTGNYATFREHFNMKKNASLSRMGEKEKYRNPKSSEGILQIFREFLSNLKNDLKLPEICFMMIGLI